jgi:hypothetical protein
VYIEASVRINAKEFKRDFYTTLYEDMVSLRAIWISCGKPNPVEYGNVMQHEKKWMEGIHR